MRKIKQRRAVCIPSIKNVPFMAVGALALIGGYFSITKQLKNYYAPLSIQFVDVNNDGYEDIQVFFANYKELRIFYGQSNETFRRLEEIKAKTHGELEDKLRGE